MFTKLYRLLKAVCVVALVVMIPVLGSFFLLALLLVVAVGAVYKFMEHEETATDTEEISPVSDDDQDNSNQ